MPVAEPLSNPPSLATAASARAALRISRSYSAIGTHTYLEDLRTGAILVVVDTGAVSMELTLHTQMLLLLLAGGLIALGVSYLQYRKRR